MKRDGEAAVRQKTDLKLTKHDLSVRIAGYMRRMHGAFGVEKHQPNQSGYWLIRWPDGETPTFVRGRFDAAAAYMVADSRYSSEWVASSNEQADNCNNGKVEVVECVAVKRPRVPYVGRKSK